MKSIVFAEYGAPEVLTVADRPVPEAGAGEVIVRVAASTVNPTDLMMRKGMQAKMMTHLTPPYVPGMEFSGTIHAVGAGVDMAPGTPVIGVVNPRRPEGGAYAEYLRVPAASVAPVPGNVDLVAASTIPMNALTAILALDLAGAQPGQSVLVTGGTGMLGGSVIWIAKARGLKVLASGRHTDADDLKAMGADIVVPRGDELVDAVLAACPGGVDALIDGALIGDAISAAVRDGGVAVSLRMSHPINDDRLTSKYVSVVDGLERADLLSQIAQMVKDGVLAPRVAPQGIYPMTEAVAAHSRAEQEKTRGRIVLEF